MRGGNRRGFRPTYSCLFQATYPRTRNGTLIHNTRFIQSEKKEIAFLMYVKINIIPLTVQRISGIEFSCVLLNIVSILIGSSAVINEGLR